MSSEPTVPVTAPEAPAVPVDVPAAASTAAIPDKTEITDVQTSVASVTTAHADNTTITAVTPITSAGVMPSVATVPTNIPDPTHLVTVPYLSPKARALSSAQRAALASIASAVLLLILRMALAFVQGGDYSKAAIQAAVIVVIQGLLTTLIVGIQKLAEVSGVVPEDTTK